VLYLVERANWGCIHDGAGVDLEAFALQDRAYLGEQGRTELVVRQEFAKLQHRGGVRNALPPKVNADKVAKACAVVQGFLTKEVSQVEPILDEVDSQHALKPNRRSLFSCLGIVGFDDDAQRNLWKDGLHRLQELVAPGGLAVALKGLVGGHDRSLLPHDPCFTHDLCDRGTYSALP
jgi:hypothetical protein